MRSATKTTKPVTTDDIRNTIKAMKTPAQEPTVDKTILKQLPNSAVASLRNIFNSTRIIGYFSVFKKAHNDNQNTENPSPS